MTSRSVLPALEITMHLEPHTLKMLGMMLVLLAGVVAWVVAILLLIEVTKQYLDVLSYIMKLAQLG